MGYLIRSSSAQPAVVDASASHSAHGLRPVGKPNSPDRIESAPGHDVPQHYFAWRKRPSSGRRGLMLQGLLGQISPRYPLSCALKLVGASGTRHALALRINHAQYDGACFSELIQTLFDIHQSRPVERVTEFSAYARHVTQQAIHSQDALRFRKQLLAGQQ